MAAVRHFVHLSHASTLSMVLMMATFTATPAIGAAQDDDTITAAARALAIEGVKLAQSDQCDAAIDKLERAEKLHHAPIVLANLGDCYVKQGRLVEGIERLRSVLREPLPSAPSGALQQAYTNSKTLLEATRPKLATLTVSVDAAPNAEASVTIDGKPIPSALLGAGRPTDPGEHLLRVTAPGYLTTTRRVSLGVGQEQSIMLGLVIDRASPRARAATPANTADAPAAALPAPPSAAATATTNAATGNAVPAYIAWGVGAAALGVGIGFGVAAINNRASLRRNCPSNACPVGEGALLHTGRLNATVSTVGYATAIGAAAIGTVLYFVLGQDERASEHTSEKQARVRASVGLTGAALSMTF